MSTSAIEQRRKTRIHVKPVVEYVAVENAARDSKTWCVDGDVIGVPIGLIHIGSAIMCRDGKAGRVVGIVTHPQRSYPTHIIVRQGQLRPRQFRVGFNWVTSIAPDYVELNLWKCDLVQQPEYLSDDEISEAVEAAFHGPEAFHDRGDYLAIQATVEDGVVSLHGTVRNSVRRLEAERIVNRLRGVIAVQNYLFEDDEIEWKTRWVLQRDPRLQIRNLCVDACLGLVRLHGQIASLSQRVLATAVVKQVPGVQAINNGLIIERDLEQPTEAISFNSGQAVEEVLVS